MPRAGTRLRRLRCCAFGTLHTWNPGLNESRYHASPPVFCPRSSCRAGAAGNAIWVPVTVTDWRTRSGGLAKHRVTWPETINRLANTALGTLQEDTGRGWTPCQFPDSHDCCIAASTSATASASSSPGAPAAFSVTRRRKWYISSALRSS